MRREGEKTTLLSENMVVDEQKLISGGIGNEGRILFVCICQDSEIFLFLRLFIFSP